jgi:hypothetical protein
MTWWRKPLAVAAGAVTMGVVGGFAASLTPQGSAALRSAEAAIVSLGSHSQPVVDAYAGGGGGSGTGPGPVLVKINADVKLTSRITANERVQINCGPFVSTYEPPYMQVQLSEAEGRTIANAYNESTPNIVCDGTFHTYTIMVQAQNEPLRAPERGAADVNVNVCGIDTSGQEECQNGSASKLVNIKK